MKEYEIIKSNDCLVLWRFDEGLVQKNITESILSEANIISHGNAAAYVMLR